MESSREALLIETKRLLASLNEENRSLKAHNTRLLTECRTASESLSRVRTEKDALERDMKQINFNLMQQMRAKVNALKEETQRGAQLQSERTGIEAQLHEARTSRESLSTECNVLRERIATLEQRVQCMTERTARAEADAGRSANELQTFIATQRETKARGAQEETCRVQEMEQALRVSRANESSLERVIEELRYELSRAREALRVSESHGSVALRRTDAARSDTLYAHEQIAHTCATALEQLRSMQCAVRDLERQAGGIGEQVSQGALSRLCAHVEQLASADEAAMAFLRQQCAEEERARSLAQQRADLAETRVKEMRDECNALAERADKRAGEAEAQVEVLRRECHALREHIAREAEGRKIETRQFATVVTQALQKLSKGGERKSASSISSVSLPGATPSRGSTELDLRHSPPLIYIDASPTWKERQE